MQVKGKRRGVNSAHCDRFRLCAVVFDSVAVSGRLESFHVLVVSALERSHGLLGLRLPAKAAEEIVSKLVKVAPQRHRRERKQVAWHVGET